MRNLLNIAINELRVNFGQPSVWITVLVVPIVMAIFLGLGGEFAGDVVLNLDVVNLDKTDLAARLIDALRAGSDEDELRLCILNGPEPPPDECDLSDEDDTSSPEALDALVQQRLDDEVSQAAIIIPTGLDAGLRAGETVEVIYRANAGFEAPGVIIQTVNAAISRASGSVTAARLVTEVDAEASFDTVYEAAEAAWETPPTDLNVQTTAEEGAVGFSQTMPGMACMFVLMNVLGVSQSVMRSRREWTFQRLIVMPVPRWGTMGGKLLAYYIIGVAQFSIILLVGTLFGVNYGSDPLAVILLMLIYTLAVAAVAMFVSTLVRSEGQAGGIATLVSLVLSPLGGAWWPLSIVPEAMQTFGRIVSPVAWAMDSFNGMVWREEVLADILPNLGVLLIWAVVFFALGVWRFKYE